MAWTAPRTWTTGEIVTAAQMNEQVRDNLNMVIQKDGSVAFAADQPMGGFSLTGLAAGAAAGESARYNELNALTAADVSGARAFATNYQNTSGKIRWCSVTVQATTTAADGEVYIDGKVGAASPATMGVAEGFAHQSSNATGLSAGILFLIPVNYYYRVDITNIGSGTNQIVIWAEGEMH